jgi:hypothetical protein
MKRASVFLRVAAISAIAVSATLFALWLLNGEARREHVAHDPGSTPQLPTSTESSASASPEVAPQSATRSESQMPRITTKLIGRVVEASHPDQPISSARIEVVSKSANPDRGTWSGDTDEHGDYRIDGIVPGVKYFVTVSHPGHVSYRGLTSMIQDAIDNVQRDIGLYRFGSIFGNVRDDGGRSLSGVSVRCVRRHLRCLSYQERIRKNSWRTVSTTIRR